VSHGEGEDRRELNASTREEIDEHKVDVKLAEVHLDHIVVLKSNLAE